MSRKELLLIPDEVLELIPEQVALRFKILPASIENGILIIFCTGDFSLGKKEQVRFILDRPVQFRCIQNSLLIRSIAEIFQKVDADIIYCGTPLRFRCPKKWENLEIGEELDQRYCPQCQETVFLCQSVEHAKEMGFAGKCVAFYDPVSEGMLLGNLEE